MYYLRGRKAQKIVTNGYFFRNLEEHIRLEKDRRKGSKKEGIKGAWEVTRVSSNPGLLSHRTRAVITVLNHFLSNKFVSITWIVLTRSKSCSLIGSKYFNKRQKGKGKGTKHYELNLLEIRSKINLAYMYISIFAEMLR